MNNTLLQLKIKQRLNKLASNDYDNIECWQFVEAFNKAQYDWCRRNLHGMNQFQEGDEQSTKRIDDFQKLLITNALKLNKNKLYYESLDLPENYFQYKLISIDAKNDCCGNKPMVVYLGEVANVDILLRDVNKQPNFEWGETFATMKSDKIQIYTNDEFTISSARLTYYRNPIRIQIKGCTDPNTLTVSTADVECEFKDDLTELIIDESVKILAGDIESVLQMQRAQAAVEQNN